MLRLSRNTSQCLTREVSNFHFDRGYDKFVSLLVNKAGFSPFQAMYKFIVPTKPLGLVKMRITEEKCVMRKHSHVRNY